VLRSLVRPSNVILAVSVVLFGGAGDGPGELQVRKEGQTVSVNGSRVPLSDVLDRLASTTGMKVVYDGPRPRRLVTVHIEGRSEVETLRALFEGLAINYALTLDPSGLHVASLILMTDGTRDGVPSGSRPDVPSPASLGTEPPPEEFPADSPADLETGPVLGPFEGEREMPPGSTPQPGFTPERTPTPIELAPPPAMPSFPRTPSNPGTT